MKTTGLPLELPIEAAQNVGRGCVEYIDSFKLVTTVVVVGGYGSEKGKTACTIKQKSRREQGYVNALLCLSLCNSHVKAFNECGV